MYREDPVTDHIARAGETFKYTENGPVGLLTDRPVMMRMNTARHFYETTTWRIYHD